MYDCIGIVPDAKGPDRQIEVVDVIAYLGIRAMDVLLDRLGNVALDQVIRLFQLLLQQGRRSPVTPDLENDGELRFVVGTRQGVTFVLDLRVADNTRAIAAMLEVNVAEHVDGTNLRWHPQLSRWLPEPPPDESTR